MSGRYFATPGTYDDGQIVDRLLTNSFGALVTSGGVPDSTGAPINPDNMAITAVTRDGDGNLLTMTITDGTSSWVQTITRDANGNLATQSVWVKQ